MENEELIENYKQKLEQLVLEGNKKTEMTNEHHDWML